MDRPEAAALSTSDGASRGILTPTDTRYDQGRMEREERLEGAGEAGARALAGSRPAAYNIPGIPYHCQITDWYCGPAALQMLMDYLGEEIGQTDISDVANDIVNDGCYATDILRSAHFSGVSAAIQNPALHGYVERHLGYSGQDRYWGEMTPAERYEDLKCLTYAGCPVLVLTWFDGTHSAGHFRLVKGYDDNLGVFIVHDPWYYGFSGPDLLVDQTFFVENLWAYSYWWGMAASPWILHPEIPSSVSVGDTFSVNLKVRYPGPNPFGGQYAASTCRATIGLSGGLALAGGSNTVALPGLASGDSASVSWDVVAVGPSGDWGMAFQAQGLITGSSHSYASYSDTIGGHAYETVTVSDPLLAGWEDEERLTTNDGSSQTCFPGARAMALEDDGTVHVVWADTKDGNSEIYYCKRTGGAWQSETRLTNDPSFSGYPCIAQGPDGRLHVAWADQRDGNEEIYYKSWDNLGGWSADERVTSYNERDISPALAAGPGAVYLAWERNAGGGLHYYFVCFSARTALGWSAPTDVDASPERDSYRPSIALGAEGLVHLVYERQTANAPNEKERIVYRNWNGSIWSSRVSLSTDLSYSRTPVIASGADSTLHVVWQDGENTGGDIFYARHNGTSWQPVTELVAGGTEASTPSVCADGAGRVHVVWVDQRHGESEIYYVGNDGVGWGAASRLTHAAAASLLPTVATNVSGELCVVWTDLRHGNAEIYFRGAEAESGVPGAIARPVASGPVFLSQPYPMPFTEEAGFTFAIEKASHVALDIFDVGGRYVTTMARGSFGAGTHVAAWDGRDRQGNLVSPGLYFVRCQALGGQQVRRVLLVR